MLDAITVNVHRQRGAKPAKAEDFLLTKSPTEDASPAKSPAQLKAIVEHLNVVFGGRDLRPNREERPDGS